MLASEYQAYLMVVVLEGDGDDCGLCLVPLLPERHGLLVVVPRVLGVLVVVPQEVRLLVRVQVAQVDLLQGQPAVGRRLLQAELRHQVLPAALRIYLKRGRMFGMRVEWFKSHNVASALSEFPCQFSCDMAQFAQSIH